MTSPRTTRGPGGWMRVICLSWTQHRRRCNLIIISQRRLCYCNSQRISFGIFPVDAAAVVVAGIDNPFRMQDLSNSFSRIVYAFFRLGERVPQEKVNRIQPNIPEGFITAVREAEPVSICGEWAIDRTVIEIDRTVKNRSCPQNGLGRCRIVAVAIKRLLVCYVFKRRMRHQAKYKRAGTCCRTNSHPAGAKNDLP